MPTYGRTLRAQVLLIRNIKALLADRGIEQEALSLWAGHQPPWISKILAGTRGVQLKDLDRIADFFGLTVAQLLTHGTGFETERRHAQRRTGIDRRNGRERRGTRSDLHPDIVRFPPARRGDDDEDNGKE